MDKKAIGAVVGLVVGAMFGYLLFNDADNVLLGTVLPTLVFAVAAAFVGYFIARSSGSSTSGKSPSSQPWSSRRTPRSRLPTMHHPRR